MPGIVNWQETVRDILNLSQDSLKAHERLLKDLYEIYKSTDGDEFSKEFIPLMTYAFSVKEISSCIDNCLKFFATFIVATTPEHLQNADDHEKNKLFKTTLSFLIKINNTSNSTVRWRLCQFFELLLGELADQNRADALGEDFWDKLLEILVERCKDKILHVRYHAVVALSKMQQPSDPDCKAIKAITFIMRFDPSEKVRIQCMRVISTTKQTIVHFVERCRDPSEAVRRYCYVGIAERKLFRYLTIEQRVTIAKRGLSERVDSVRTTCERQVMSSWMIEVKNDIPELIRRLDSITSKETCELVLSVLFQQTIPAELVDMFATMTENWGKDDWITPDRIFCLRGLVQYITTPQKATQRFNETDVDEWMEKLVPSLYSLVEFVEGYIMKEIGEDMDLYDGPLRRDFIINQLLDLLSLIDKSDAAGRNRLQKMLETVTTTASPGALPGLVRLHLEAHQNIERTIEWMAFTISEWTAAPTPIQLIANGHANQTVSFLQFNNTTVNEDVPEDATMEQSLFKALTMLSEVLKSSQVKTLTATLRSLYENLVLPAIQNEDPNTRNAAFRCLGLSCLIDRDLTKKHLILFLQKHAASLNLDRIIILKVDFSIVRETAIGVLFDLLLVYGKTVSETVLPESYLSNGENGSQENKVENAASVVILELEKILESEEVQLHDLVAGGLARLELYAPKLVSKRRRNSSKAIEVKDEIKDENINGGD